MSSGSVIVEVSRNNSIKKVSLDSSSHTYGWQVIQAIQDGGENSTASENIILRTRNGVRLLPTKKLEAVTKSKTKTNLCFLFAQIMGEGEVKENGEQGDKVKSDSEHCHSNSSTHQLEASKDKHPAESSQELAPTENKKRKVQCNQVGDSSKHAFIKGSTCGHSSSKKSTRQTDSQEHEVITDSPAKPQQEMKRCSECGSTAKRQSTLKIGFKRNHGWIGEDQSPSNSKVNLTLSQRGCPSLATHFNLQEKLKSSDNECSKKESTKKESTKIETLGVASCIDTQTKTGTLFSNKVKQVSENCTALGNRPSSTKESLGTLLNKSVEFKSRYFPNKDNEDSTCSTNKTLKIKRKSAKSIKANTSPESISECSSTQINKEISGSSLVESTDVSCGYPVSKVKSRKMSAEVVINTNGLHAQTGKIMDRWISTSNFTDVEKLASDDADVGISTSDDAGVSTSVVADCQVKNTKDRKVSANINNRHSKNAKKEGKKSSSKSEDQNADCSSTTDTLNKSANSGHRKHKIISTQYPVDQGKSTTKCVDIVAKQFEHGNDENGVQPKFHLINLQAVHRNPSDLVENFVENGLVEPKEVLNGEQSFIDDLHDDEINSIHTEDCDSEEPDRGTHSSAYIADDAVVINIGRNELRRSDLDTLHEGEWLNDCVINAYFILLGDVSPLNVFSHSSFFFWSLYKRGYEGVQRWTKNVDLFAQDVIFIPVHNKSHWTLVAVHVKEGIIEYYNSSTFHDGYPPSMKHVEQYLKAEAVHRGKTKFCNFNWKMFIPDQIPRQQNSDDCGLFICQYAKKICLKQKINFNAEKTNILRQQMRHELLQEEIEKDEPKDGMS